MLESANVLVVLAGLQAPPTRAWIDQLWFLVPADSVTRWLLLLDVSCLVLIGLRLRPTSITVPAALAGGFLILNGFALALTDFFLALAAFHLAVAVATVLALRERRWIGVAAVTLVVVLGVVT